MNISSLYDKSIKMLDECYARLLKIWSLPRGSISKKKINNRIYYYHQYRNGNKVYSKILKKDETINLRKLINERKRLIALNNKDKDSISKNIKVIAVFDKGLSATLMDEFFAFSFDEIPVNERSHLELPFMNLIIRNGEERTPNQTNLNDYLNRWLKGEIRAREISNYIIRKISD